MQTIANYNLSAIDRQHVLSVLTSSFDQEQAQIYWEEACQSVGVPETTNDMAELEKIFDYFGQKRGRLAIHGMSFKMRLMTFQNLKALQTQKAG